MTTTTTIQVTGASEHNLRDLDVTIERGAITVVTGVSGSGKSSLAFDTILAESNRRFFHTLSHYTRQFLDVGTRPEVRRVTGLSPAIALAQNETLVSRRATVGSLTEASELMGVLFARFGEQRCPKHHLPTAALHPDVMADTILSLYAGKTLAICASLAHAKKGHFQTQLAGFAKRGFMRAWIDGKMVGLEEKIALGREEKHTIKIVIDALKIKADSRSRLLRSLNTALEEGQGFAEYYVCDLEGNLLLSQGGNVSSKGGCPQCGFAWPRLDSRYFNPNSLGSCKHCEGLGVLGLVIESEDEDVEDEDEGPAADLTDTANTPCPHCQGTGLKSEMGAIRYAGHSMQDFLARPVREVNRLLALPPPETLRDNPAFARVKDEVTGLLKRVEEVGLGYLSLTRRIRTLSGGEAQRLRLAGILGESLRGVLYVLDEPSQGLHPSELRDLTVTLRRLCDQGNTLLLVDHDEIVMRAADWIVDLGPGGGAEGGQLMARFRPKDAADWRNQSATARMLSDPPAHLRVEVATREPSAFITIKKPTIHHLKMPVARFAKGAFNVVTGVSGAGKSSLAVDTLYGNALRLKTLGEGTHLHCDAIAGLEGITDIELVDRRPVAKSSVSMPATYLDVFTDLRNLFAKLPEAQVAGMTPRTFSLHAEGGRCEECRGRGEILLQMKFLSDARVPCPRCKGLRYRSNVLDVRFAGLNFSDVLRLTIAEAARHFARHRRIIERLQPAIDLGLGYLKMGQPSASLSGGEAQRLKLVPYLTRPRGHQSLMVIDEPTTGLHREDVARLVVALRRLADQGVTLVVVEHHEAIIHAADWQLDVGPGAADAGGQLVYEGRPREV